MLYEHIDQYAKLTYSVYAEFTYPTYLKNMMKYRGETLLADDSMWQAIFEPALCEDAGGVETLARLLFTLKKAIDSGPEGALRASQTLLTGIELLYLYTNAHKAALKLYVLSLEGNLKPQDEPLQLINAALERARATRASHYWIVRLWHLTPGITRAPAQRT